MGKQERQDEADLLCGEEGNQGAHVGGKQGPLDLQHKAVAVSPRQALRLPNRTVRSLCLSRACICPLCQALCLPSLG